MAHRLKYSGPISDSFDFIKQHESKMSVYQRDFVKGLQKHYKKHHSLSEQQLDCLLSIVAFYETEFVSFRDQ